MATCRELNRRSGRTVGARLSLLALFTAIALAAQTVPQAFAATAADARCRVAQHPGTGTYPFTVCESADLTGIDLHGVDLRGASFSHSNLSNGTLRAANLSAFTDASGKHAANLFATKLTGTDLSGANLSGAYLADSTGSGMKLSGANFAGADIADSVWSNSRPIAQPVNLQKVYADGFYGDHLDLSGSDLRGAAFSNGVLTGVILRNANLAGASLHASVLDSLTDLSGANLTGAYLAQSDMAAKFTGASLVHANLTSAYVGGADFTDANLTGALLTGANFAGAKLARAMFTGSSALPMSLSRTFAGPSAVYWTIPSVAGLSTKCLPASGTVFDAGVHHIACTVSGSNPATSGSGKGTFDVTVRIQLHASSSLSKASQVYGVAPSAKVTVSAGRAVPGVASVFIDGRVAAWVSSTNGVAGYSLSTRLARGRHSITTTYRPTSPYFLASSTAPRYVTVR